MTRLTPMDIFEKDFKVSMRGYDKEEVNEFLDLVIKSYEEVLEENEKLKEQLKNQAGKPTATNVQAIPDLSEYDAVINETIDRQEILENRVQQLERIVKQLERMIKPR